MPTGPGSQQRWCTSELWYAAQQLRLVGALLEAVPDDHRGLGQLTSSEPEVQAALQRYLDRWELPLWGVGQEALSLADTLETAADGYASTETELGQAFLDHAQLPWAGCA